jgi:hypothetical protein
MRAKPIANARLPAALLAIAGVLLCCADAAAEEPDVSLTVKPTLCITDKREDRCALAIVVAWRSSEPGNYCLHSELEGEPLRCWALAQAGTLVDERNVAETFRYWITADVGDARLAEASLDVMTADSDDRRRQRPRRHVWNIL